MSPRGGARPGAGRRPKGAAPVIAVTVTMPEEAKAEIVAGLHDGESLSSLMTDAALAVVRGRSSDETA